MDLSFVYITAGSEEEARSIARTIVAEKLAACVNILPNMNSFYEWNGEVHDDRELVLICKTRAENFERLKTRVVELHSYDCPCVVELELKRGHAPFLEWIEAQTAS